MTTPELQWFSLALLALMQILPDCQFQPEVVMPSCGTAELFPIVKVVKVSQLDFALAAKTIGQSMGFVYLEHLPKLTPHHPRY